MSAPDPAAAFEGLNPEQRAAVAAVKGPVCVLAGAGSGKTTTIAHRIANQVRSGVAEPEQILAVTFTDKAAGQLRRHLHALGIPRPVRAATFHAAAWAQLRYFWPRVNDGPIPDVLSSKVRLLVPSARRLRVEARDLAAEIEWAKARCLDPDGYLERAPTRTPPVPAERMARVYAAYEREKAARRLIDYEDMLLDTARLLAARPEVADAVRDRYRSFTVDEFQDVNPAQWALLRAWLGESREVCVVGDDDQTIYTFTGATSDYLTGFRAHFPEARLITLTRNYRSTAEILALANRILWTKPSATRKQLRAQSAGGPAPRLAGFDDDAGERDAVVRRIRALIRESVPPGEIALCYRVNSQSEPFEEALTDAGIPFVVRAAGGFFERPEIRQALGVLRAATDRPAADPTPAPAGARRRQPPAADRTVARVLREQLSFHPLREPAGEAARERWRNLGALLGIVERSVAAHPSVSFEALVADLARRAAAGDPTADEHGAVTLLTLHRAKGLEFDAVFLVACEEGLLPISHAQDDADVEEERRLLYVGVTRARRYLWLSWAARRQGWGGKPVPRRPSRFLYNLGPGAPQSTRRSPRPAVQTAVDPDLFERLRQWRLRRAQADGVPAFVVCNDRTLTQLAADRPGTTRALLGVHGLGPAKVQRYGHELLAVLADGHHPGGAGGPHVDGPR